MVSDHVHSFQSSPLGKDGTKLPTKTRPRLTPMPFRIAPGRSLSSLYATEKQGEVQRKASCQPKKLQAHKVALSALFALAAFFGTAGVTSANDAILDTASASSSTETTTANTVRTGLNARRYWNIMASQEEGANELRVQANEGLLEHAVGTVNTMYYDNTGGARFTSLDYYDPWRTLRDETSQHAQEPQQYKGGRPTLATRAGTVDNLKWLISTLNDPFSKYLTREELWQEFNVGNDGFLGSGALVETPEQGEQFFARGSSPTLATVVPDESDILVRMKDIQNNRINKNIPPLSAGTVQNLPVVTAVVPDSPAERSGITVGDRIVAVGDYSFLGQSRGEVSRNFQTRFAAGSNYFGTSHLTVAKPVVRSLISQQEISAGDAASPTLLSSAAIRETINREREVVIGYRQTRAQLPTKSSEEGQFASASPVTATSSADRDLTFVASSSDSGVNLGSMGSSLSISANTAIAPPTKGGNAIVHWELISGESPQSSIFQRSISWASSPSSSTEDSIGKESKVGYIRLTRFSKSSTAGYIEAVQALEQAGATSFIIDVRNNYGGVIQEAMLTASTLLRDPHAVLCYTLNSRGGFGPHDVEEYLVDKRYPGYMMSREPRWATLNQAQRENPDYFEDGGSRWTPPSSYASLREQTVKRGLHRPSYSRIPDGNDIASSILSSPWFQWNIAAAKAFNDHADQWSAQQNLVILINEGTASAAEVFASALHDNGRTLAVIGTNSYGKGLIQHTFPMPDGGALRLTVAEYLTPALHHVTVVGNAKFDPFTGDQVGGGIKPDVYCASKQGIPSNVGADLCVGMALEILEEAEAATDISPGPEKHHRQQHLKERQKEEDFRSKGILPNDSGASILSANANSWDALEHKIRANTYMQVGFPNFPDIYMPLVVHAYSNSFSLSLSFSFRVTSKRPRLALLVRFDLGIKSTSLCLNSRLQEPARQMISRSLVESGVHKFGNQAEIE